MSRERPLIAVNGRSLTEPREALRLDNRYALAVLKAGGVPVGIPPVGGPADLEHLLERVDGLLLAGGDDFDTERLGLGPTHPAARPVPSAKQDFDFVLARSALRRRLPVLGVCYGMQLLALAEGGRLFQHLPEDRPGRREHGAGARHDVELAAGSKLSRFLGVERMPVVSRHHQAVEHVPAPWRVAASDDEGLVEAIEHPELPFALGVQWHPEEAPEGSADQRLFGALVGAAGMAARRATQPV